MRVLGVTLDSRMSWSEHISKTINKMNSLTGALKFLRTRLTQKQFLQVLTSQYYSACYYGSPVWLGCHTKKIDLNKLNSLHYRLLRIAACDWKCKISRKELDNLGRANPAMWGKYSTASVVIKAIRDGEPFRLCDHLRENRYSEVRSKRVRFFDSSK
jgi:hypothetical protein